LKRLGHEVFLIGDDVSPIADLKLPEFNYKQNQGIIDVQSMAFGDSDSKPLEKAIEILSQDVEAKIEQFWRQKHFSLIFVHNIFSLPVCLPATVAMYKFLRKHPSVNAIGVHHDFFWDPSEKQNT